MTQAEQRQQDAAVAGKQVQQLLGWSLQQYHQFMYDMGLEFLEQYFPNDPWWRSQLEGNSMFWAWWRNLWLLREELFLKHAADILWADRIDEYRRLHNPVELADENTQMGRFVDTSYCRMMRDIQRKQVTVYAE